MLDSVSLEALKGKKNLLAFSGGADSTALFFLLMEADIDFDIALVNYNTRTSSKDEEEYAKELGSKYGKKCFTKSVKLPKKDFEASARRERYGFFEEIIKEHGYDSLVTAHQLNDKLEWFLMRFAKGAGVRELSGMKAVSKEDDHAVVKPLLKTSKNSLYEYLKVRKIKYFEDESNDDKSYERNYFRHEFSNAFLDKFESGVARSFEILGSEATMFESEFFRLGSLVAFKSISKDKDISNAALALKQIGYLPSFAQRDEIGEKFDAVVGGAFCVAKSKDGYVYVTPYMSETMQKEFKEACRVSLVPSKVRGYLSKNGVNPKNLKSEIDYFFGCVGGVR